MRLVPVEYLKENSYVAINVIDDSGKLMLKEGKRITSTGIQVLNKLGIAYVYIYDQYCFNNKYNRYTMELDRLHDTMVELKEIANKVIAGNSDATDFKIANSIAHKIVDDISLLPEDFKIVYEPSKLIANSVVERSIYVAIMSTVLGSKMKLSKDKLVKLCLAALLKDICLISPKFIQPEEVLSNAHPILSYEYFKKNYNLDEEILLGILQHHERFDGSGYPHQLKCENICEFAKIIGIIDAFYEIKTKHRLIHEGHGILELRIKKFLKTLDVKMLSYFIKNAEIFILDTMIKLTNDDIGVVIKNNQVNPFRPVIKIIKSNSRDEGEIIDLQDHPKLAIKNIQYYIDD